MEAAPTHDYQLILEILRHHGEEIMKRINEKALMVVEEDEEGDDVPAPVDCANGMEVLASIFGFHRTLGTRDALLEPEITSQTRVGYTRPCEYLEKWSFVNLKLMPNRIHFCQLNTENSNGDYSTDQVHYFVVVHDKNPMLLQTFGGVPGITVKPILTEINSLITQILNCQQSVYRDLFEIPAEFSHLLEFDRASFQAVSLPLVYPSLKELNNFFSIYGLNYTN